MTEWAEIRRAIEDFGLDVVGNRELLYVNEVR